MGINIQFEIIISGKVMYLYIKNVIKRRYRIAGSIPKYLSCSASLENEIFCDCTMQ